MQLLAYLPTDTGLGFVLVQHLDPQRKSALWKPIVFASFPPTAAAISEGNLDRLSRKALRERFWDK